MSGQVDKCPCEMDNDSNGRFGKVNDEEILSRIVIIEAGTGKVDADIESFPTPQFFKSASDARTEFDGWSFARTDYESKSEAISRYAKKRNRSPADFGCLDVKVLDLRKIVNDAGERQICVSAAPDVANGNEAHALVHNKCRKITRKATRQARIKMGKVMFDGTD